MSERTQRIVWTVLALIAVGLSIATVYLHLQTRPTSLAAKGAYRIAYVAEREGSFRIFTSSAEGTDRTALSKGQVTELFPVCEPVSDDSSREPRIAFLRLDLGADEAGDSAPGVPGGVYVVSHKGGQPTEVSGGVDRIVGFAPSWSPDGQQLVFAGVEDVNRDGEYSVDESGLYVSDVETAQARRVASALLGGRRILWSPAGEYVIATGREPGNPVPMAFMLEISTGVTYTHPDIEQVTMACWSPDGSRIAAYSKHDHKIHVLNDEGDEVYAFDAPPGDVFDLVWTSGDTESPERLYAVSGYDSSAGAGPLYTRSALPDPEERWTGVGGAQTYTLFLSTSPDGRYLAYTRFSSRQEGNLYVLERGQEEPRLLTSEPGFEGLATWIPVQ